MCTCLSLQVLPIQIALDNIVTDPSTDDLWIAVSVHPLKISEYFKDRTVPMPALCLHVHLNTMPEELPFTNYSIEEVLSSTGEDGVVGTISVCMYSQGRLVVGSVGHDMMLCNAPYLMH